MKTEKLEICYQLPDTTELLVAEERNKILETQRFIGSRILREIMSLLDDNGAELIGYDKRVVEEAPENLQKQRDIKIIGYDRDPYSF